MLLKATVDNLEFALVEDHGRYRWNAPDGSPTALTADTPVAAVRAFAFHALTLADEWREHHVHALTA